MTRVLLLVASLGGLVAAQPRPADRVYTADQNSNTVSVISPVQNRRIHQIVLGNPRPDVLSPLYRGQLNVHGLGSSPDNRTLAVVSVGSNSVTFIETATNKVKGVAYIGRSPHEGSFTPDGREFWCAVRGEDYVSVIDSKTFRETGRIQVADGPGMLLFTPDGKYAFVVHSFTPEVHIVRVQDRQVSARIPVVSPFSPNLAIRPDGAEVWLTHKDVGKVTIIDATSFQVKHVLTTGPITNHVNFVTRARQTFAWVTVGGENVVNVYNVGSPPVLVETIPTGSLPHGLWPSAEGSRMYVALENEGAVAVFDTDTRREVARVPTGEAPQAIVYVPGVSVEDKNLAQSIRRKFPRSKG